MGRYATIKNRVANSRALSWDHQDDELHSQFQRTKAKENSAFSVGVSCQNKNRIINKSPCTHRNETFLALQSLYMTPKIVRMLQNYLKKQWISTAVSITYPFLSLWCTTVLSRPLNENWLAPSCNIELLWGFSGLPVHDVQCWGRWWVSRTHGAWSCFLFQALLCFKLGVECSIRGRQADVQRQMWHIPKSSVPRALCFLAEVTWKDSNNKMKNTKLNLVKGRRKERIESLNPVNVKSWVLAF